MTDERHHTPDSVLGADHSRGNAGDIWRAAEAQWRDEQPAPVTYGMLRRWAGELATGEPYAIGVVEGAIRAVLATPPQT